MHVACKDFTNKKPLLWEFLRRLEYIEEGVLNDKEVFTE